MMNRNSLFAAGVASLAIMVSACSPSSNPTSSNTTLNSNSRGENPGILARLENPEVIVDPASGSAYRLVFTAGASGTSDSEPMVAARTVTGVDFEMYAPNGAIIDKESAREVFTTGVKGPDEGASLTVVAETEWPITASIQPGSYVIATVRGRNGETLIRRTDIPTRGDR